MLVLAARIGLSTVHRRGNRLGGMGMGIGYRAAIVAVLVATNTGAFAAEPKNITFGPGNHSCAKFGAAVKATPDAEELYFVWAQGFLTAFAAFFTILNRPIDGLEKTSQAQLKADIRSFCNRNPLSTYSNAVQDVFTEAAQGGKRAR